MWLVFKDGGLGSWRVVIGSSFIVCMGIRDGLGIREVMRVVVRVKGREIR